METASEVKRPDGLDIDGLVRAVEQVSAGAVETAAPEMDPARTAFQAWIREEDRRGKDFALCW